MISFSVQGSLSVFILLTILSVYLIYRYHFAVKAKPLVLRIFMITIRFLVMLTSLLLVLNLMIHWWGKHPENPAVAMYIDQSLSMNSMVPDTDDFSEKIEALKNRISEFTDILDIKGFDQTVSTVDDGSGLFFDGEQTRFQPVMDDIRENHYHHSFIVSDGIISAGPEIKALKWPGQQTIHTIGVGQQRSDADFWINDVVHPNSIVEGDSVDLVISAGFMTEDEYRSELQVKSGGRVVYSQPLDFSTGNGYRELEVRIPSDKLDEHLSVELVSAVEDARPENDEYHFQIDLLSRKENVLFITGLLSDNTHFIKSVLSKLPRIDLSVHYRVNTQQWNEHPSVGLAKNPRLIVLDNFPGTPADRTFLTEITDYCEINQIPLQYFEGPAGSGITAGLFGAEFGYQLASRPKKTLINIERSLQTSGFVSFRDLELIPPQKTNHKWVVPRSDVLLGFSDDSPVLVRNTRRFPLTALFMPELARTHLKIQPSPQALLLENLIHNLLLSDFVNDGGLVRLSTDRTNYYPGDVIQVTAEVNRAVQSRPTHMRLLVLDESGQQIDSVAMEPVIGTRQFATHLPADGTGQWKLKSEIHWDSGETEQSEIKTVTMQTVHLEEKILTPDFDGLAQISQMTGGMYRHIEQLDSLLDNIKLTAVQNPFDNRFSGLDVLPYLWILILLLTIEWIIRKRAGLL